MRASIIGTAALAALVLTGCGQSSGGSVGAPVKSDCGDQSPGPIYGAPSTTEIVDQVVNWAGPGRPFSLKPAYAAGLGVCVDGTTGDINLYGDKASGATITMTFANELNGAASWPTDASQTIRVSQSANGAPVVPPANWNPAPSVSGAGSILVFTVPYEKGRTYSYHLEYIGPGGGLRTIAARIINH